MPGFRKTAFFVTILVGTFLLTACPSQTNISKLNSDPGRYRGNEVGVVGRVTDSCGVWGSGGYGIDDGTGRIWVATRRGFLSRGVFIGTKGYLHSGFNNGKSKRLNSSHL